MHKVARAGHLILPAALKRSEYATVKGVKLPSPVASPMQAVVYMTCSGIHPCTAVAA